MADASVNLTTLAAALRKARLQIALAVLAGAGMGIVWGLVSRPVYESVILAAPVEPDSQSLGALAGPLGLASLVGLAPTAQVTRKNEAIATLQSRAFLNAFVGDLKLLPVLFGDPEARSWLQLPGMSPRAPTLEDAYELLTTEVLSVSDDRRTGLVEITVRWVDPMVAAEWGRELLARLNREMQQRAVGRSAREMQFLQKELDRTGSVEIRQAIFNLIEAQLKTTMLANVSEEFALRVVDPPLAADPHRPVSLSMAARVVLGALAAGLLSIAVVIGRVLPAALRE